MPCKSSSSPSRGDRHNDERTGGADEAYHEDASSSYLYEEDREDSDDTDFDAYEEEEEDAEERLLKFSEFPLDPDMARHHHRIVTLHCFTQFVAIGTNQGFLLLFDHQQTPPTEHAEDAEVVGSTQPDASTSDKATAPYALLLRALHHHTEPIQDVSGSADERYLASIDKTGTVVIQCLTDEADVWTRRTDQPIASVALHPHYGHHDERPFLCASGEKVQLWTRSSLLLGHRRSVVLSDHHGKVRQVRWCHTACDLVAWLTERGVCVYDVESRQLLRFIPRPAQGTIRLPALYPSSLVWDTVAMSSENVVPKADSEKAGGAASVLCWGWADWVQEVRVSPTSPSPSLLASSSPPPGKAENVHTIGRWAVQVMPALLTSSSVACASASDCATNASSPEHHLYPGAHRDAASVSPAGASAARSVGAGEDGSYASEEEEALPMRVCGLMPFGALNYLVLAAMTDPKMEGTMIDLEVRVVERRDLNPLYRGRLLVPLAHPLQLSLNGVYSHARGGLRMPLPNTTPATTATGQSEGVGTSLHDTSARASSLSSSPSVGVRDSYVTPHMASAEAMPRHGSGLSNDSRARSTPLPSSPPLSRSPPTGQAAPTAWHHTGCSEVERLQALARLYTDPTRAGAFPPDEAVFYITSLNKVVLVTPSGLDDHVSFLIEQGALREAYEYVKPRAHLLQRHNLDVIGEHMLAQMLEEVDDSVRRAELPSTDVSDDDASRSAARAVTVPATTTDDIVRRLPEVLGSDYTRWERWIFLLDQRGDSWRLAPVLPGAGELMDGNRPDKTPTAPLPATKSGIGAQYYDLVLLRCLERDAVLFNDTLRRCENLYHPEVLLKPLESRYRAAVAKSRSTAPRASVQPGTTAFIDEDTTAADAAMAPLHTEGMDTSSPSLSTAPATLTFEEAQLYALGEAYGRLLRQLGRDEEALGVLLRVERSRELFTFIRAKGLFAKTLDILPDLFARSADRTLKLLLEHACPRDAPRTAEPRTQGGDRGAIGAPRTASLDTKRAPTRPTSVTVSEELQPEQIVKRLQGSDRQYLWQYLVALRQAYPDVFSGVARRHAQLVATLYMDYSPQDLLAFLKQMSMYLDKMQEIYALCKKNQLIEEMLFIMARLGKEEEGVRVIVGQQKNMRKAVDFVLSIPSKNEQRALFRRLVEFAVITQEGLPLYHSSPCHGAGADKHGETTTSTERMEAGALIAASSPRMPTAPPFAPKHVSAEALRFNRYFVYTPLRGETLAMVSARFAVPIDVLRGANHMPDVAEEAEERGARGTVAAAAGSKPTHDAAPSPCIVPVNLLASLLLVISDPAYWDHPAIDVRYVLQCLPEGEPLPGAAPCVAALLHARAAAIDFQSNVLSVTEMDLSEYYGLLLKRRTAAVRMCATDLFCSYCGQREPTSFLQRDDGERRLAACRGVLRRHREVPSMTGASHWPNEVPLETVSSVFPRHTEALASGGAVVFPCRHVYHPACLLQSLIADGSLREEYSAGTSIDVRDFLARPEAYAAPRLHHQLPYCRLCMQTSAAPSQ